MHVLVIGTQRALINSLLDLGHAVTLVHDITEVDRVDKLWASSIDSVPIRSGHAPESILGGLACRGAGKGIDCVVPGEELAVVPASMVGALLGARSMPVDTAIACRNKAVQKARWRGHVPTARWCVVTGAGEIAVAMSDAGIGFPCVVKPLDKGGTTDVGIVRTPEQIAARLAEVSAPLLVEEYLDLPEWHLDGVIQSGRITHFMVSRYRNPVLMTKQEVPVQSMTYPLPGNGDLYAEAAEFATLACTALSLADGVFHLEAFGAPGDFVAGELACRPGAGMIPQVARMTADVDLWAAVGRIGTGAQVPPGRVESREYVGFVNLPSVAGEANTVDITAFSAFDWVIEVVERRAVGEIMRDMTKGVGFGMGYVMMRADSVEQLRHRLDTVTDMMRTAQRLRTGIEV